jgi:hypothetical protein
VHSMVEAIVIADLTVEALTAKVAEPPTRSSQAIDGSNYDSTVCDSMFLTVNLNSLELLYVLRLGLIPRTGLFRNSIKVISKDAATHSDRGGRHSSLLILHCNFPLSDQETYTTIQEYIYIHT